MLPTQGIRTLVEKKQQLNEHSRVLGENGRQVVEPQLSV